MDSLFPPSFRAQVERLAASFLRLKSTIGSGTALKTGLDARHEFAGHVPYAPGADLRDLDWAVYGRMRKLYLKQFVREQERILTLVPDLTASMWTGSPDKRIAALRITATLAALALKKNVTVELALSGGRRRFDSYQRFGAVLAQLESAGQSEPPFFLEMARSLCSSGNVPRNTIVISDIMEDPKALRNITPLAAGGRKLAILGVLSPEEFSPSQGGSLALQDSETGGQLELFLGPDALASYRKELEAHLDTWRSLCLRHRIALEVFSSSQALDELILRVLPQAGVLS